MALSRHWAHVINQHVHDIRRKLEQAQVGLNELVSEDLPEVGGGDEGVVNLRSAVSAEVRQSLWDAYGDLHRLLHDGEPAK